MHVAPPLSDADSRELPQLVAHGVAFHHAGLRDEDAGAKAPVPPLQGGVYHPGSPGLRGLCGLGGVPTPSSIFTSLSRSGEVDPGGAFFLLLGLSKALFLGDCERGRSEE